MEPKQWDVRIFISEDDDDDVTTAKAVLVGSGGRRYESVAYARRNPDDQPVPEIGDELAAGRALAELAGRLMREGAEDVAERAQQAARAW
ncbi:DUF1876 domain-containing protein [Streptosporangium lutulentum]|uniref:DUF1876 domain-containing protein n=1 Tax=Streptosporangium lutulentum TaxID=1461250 RepID=A0ABT9QMU4_9ACTN|nr:DUF1876 domain-containing protein [Streptosporangium lutulentum]MDP9848081.1 hypothetical protein [Streptosporangium lutulentum]